MKKLKEKKYVLLNIMSIVAFLLFWQGFSIYNQTAEIMNPKYLPGPIEVVQTVIEYIFDKGTLFQHIWTSLYRILGGFLLGSVVAVAVDPLEQLFHRPFLAALRSPRFRVVAVFAPQGTPLQKHHKAHTGAVHRAEGFQRVDIADGVTGLHGRCGR